MKRVTSWLIIISLTFVFGATAATLFFLNFNVFTMQKPEEVSNSTQADNANDLVNLPQLAFCELANNPETYDGKVMRLSASLSFGLEGAWFSDSKCKLTDNAAIVSYKNEEVGKLIGQAREQKGKKFLSNELNVIVVGRFKNEIYKDCCLITPFQFEILKVEKVSKTN